MRQNKQYQPLILAQCCKDTVVKSTTDWWPLLLTRSELNEKMTYCHIVDNIRDYLIYIDIHNILLINISHYTFQVTSWFRVYS